ncbi:MAG: hypothetical protein NTX25_23540 [Proteobacteria bacterium]|nr:hypothetical protein [Pseudomonadota bacterium]
MPKCWQILILLATLATAFPSLPSYAGSPSLQDAFRAYEDQDFTKAYRISMTIARNSKATKRSRALVMAAAAALELDKENQAISLFERAIEIEADIGLPDVVIKSPRALHFFQDVLAGRKPGRSEFSRIKVPPNFNDPLIYLPLGFNQYLQSKPILGSAFGAIQLVSIYGIYTSYQNADRVEGRNIKARQTAILTGNDINPEYVRLDAANKKYVREQREMASIYGVLAVAAFAASVFEAGYYPTSPGKTEQLSVNPLEIRIFNSQGRGIDLRIMALPDVSALVKLTQKF